MNDQNKPSPNKKRRPKRPSNSAQSAAPNAPQKRRRKRPQKRRDPNKPRLAPLDRIIVKYENLREQHIEARRKYFDLFERADPQQKDKLERVFTNTMAKIREFEESLRPEDKELFDKHYNSLSLDTVYSENHELDPEGQPIAIQANEIEDPHFTESQKMADFQTDKEESVGSIEDYRLYKGIE